MNESEVNPTFIPGSEIEITICEFGVHLTMFCPFCSAQVFGSMGQQLMEDFCEHMNEMHAVKGEG